MFNFLYLFSPSYIFMMHVFISMFWKKKNSWTFFCPVMKDTEVIHFSFKREILAYGNFSWVKFERYIWKTKIILGEQRETMEGRVGSSATWIFIYYSCFLYYCAIRKGLTIRCWQKTWHSLVEDKGLHHSWHKNGKLGKRNKTVP